MVLDGAIIDELVLNERADLLDFQVRIPSHFRVRTLGKVACQENPHALTQPAAFRTYIDV